MNISCPINNTGYGIASLNIVRALNSINSKISLFPLGQPGVNSQEDYILISRLINNSTEADYLAPYLKIWHQFDLDSHIGKGKYYAYPFFELDTFDRRERNHLSVPDTILVSSEWAKSVIINNDIKSNVAVAPLGVDTKIFDYTKYPTNTNNNDIYIFGNIGKWEIRKGHDILYDLFQKAFPDQKDVGLNMLASETTNNYSSPQELQNWKSIYSKDERIKILSGVKDHQDIATFISQINCGIFPSRAEGWNLELLECMAMNKPTIATNYSAHTEFCNNDNCLLTDIKETERAFDGKAFRGQGNWAKITDQNKDDIIDYMRYCYKNRITTNINGVKTANKFSWQNTANLIHRCMYN
jgi:glycosyltransferase involved in cell wall biosynthesis